MIIKPSTALRNEYGTISDMAHKEDGPIYITKNGEGDLVVMSIEAFERREAMGQLTYFPLSGPPVRDDELSAAGYRYILAGKYLVFYRLLEGTVVIYHIVHGATDYPKLLKTSFFT